MRRDIRTEKNNAFEKAEIVLKNIMEKKKNRTVENQK